MKLPLMVLCIVALTFAEEKCVNPDKKFIIFYGAESEYLENANDMIKKLKQEEIQHSDLAKYAEYELLIFFESRITDLCREFFKPIEKNVKRLFINKFDVQRIEDGTFYGMTNLKHLGVFQHRIAVLQKGVFSDLPIEILEFGGNAIAGIESDAFDGLPNLEKFSIIGNRLEKVDQNWFKDSSKLYDVTMDHCKISELPEYAFKYMIDGTNCQLAEKVNKCPRISLIGNHMTRIDPKAFANFKNIEKINLLYNQLTELPNIFDGVNIKKLNLQDNSMFKCFDDDIIQAMKKSELIELDQISFTKECFEKLEKELGSILVYPETILKN